MKVELKKGDKIYQIRTKVVWEVIDVASGQYRTCITMQSQGSKRVIKKDYSDMTEYRPVGYTNVDPKRPKWKVRYTINEIKYICENHGELSNKEIGDKLGRSKQTISTMVSQLKKSRQFYKYHKGV